jgi:hypothetical protein
VSSNIRWPDHAYCSSPTSSPRTAGSAAERKSTLIDPAWLPLLRSGADRCAVPRRLPLRRVNAEAWRRFMDRSRSGASSSPEHSWTPRRAGLCFPGSVTAGVASCPPLVPRGCEVSSLHVGRLLGADGFDRQASVGRLPPQSSGLVLAAARHSWVCSTPALWPWPLRHHRDGAVSDLAV